MQMLLSSFMNLGNARRLLCNVVKGKVYLSFGLFGLNWPVYGTVHACPAPLDGAIVLECFNFRKIHIISIRDSLTFKKYVFKHCSIPLWFTPTYFFPCVIMNWLKYRLPQKTMFAFQQLVLPFEVYYQIILFQNMLETIHLLVGMKFGILVLC